MNFLKRRYCTHANVLWIRRKKKLIRKCVRCGQKIRYGEKVSYSD